MPKVHIVLCGVAHSDPAPWNVLFRQVKQLHSQGHNIIIGNETENTTTLKKSLHFTMYNYKFGLDIKKLQQLAAESRGKVPADKKEAFLRSCHCKEDFKDFDQALLTVQGNNLNPMLLQYHEAFKERLSFFLILVNLLFLI